MIEGVIFVVAPGQKAKSISFSGYGIDFGNFVLTLAVKKHEETLAKKTCLLWHSLVLLRSTDHTLKGNSSKRQVYPLKQWQL